MSDMQIMDPTGHTTISWDPTIPAEVETARKMFVEMTGKGYRAFEVEDGAKGERMTAFDAAAAEIVLIPQLVGG